VLSTTLPQVEGAVFTFQTLSGELAAKRLPSGDLELDFPADDLKPVEGDERTTLSDKVKKALGGKVEVLDMYRGRLDVVVELKMLDGANLADLDVEYNQLVCHSDRDTDRFWTNTSGWDPQSGFNSRCVVLTTDLAATRGSSDTPGPLFHSRVCSPGPGQNEDPVTGSAHCSLGVLYSQRFGGPGAELSATQGGPRRGSIRVSWDGKPGSQGGRMKLRGTAFTGTYREHGI
jgi:hypothetical protein